MDNSLQEENQSSLQVSGYQEPDDYPTIPCRPFWSASYSEEINEDEGTLPKIPNAIELPRLDWNSSDFIVTEDDGEID
jgi:hypothetical protein